MNQKYQLYQIFFIVFLLFIGNVSHISTAETEHSIQNNQPLQQHTTMINEPQYYAIIIGIDDQHGLSANSQSAISFYQQLTKGVNWDKENIQVLINEDATKTNIKSSITKWLSPREHDQDVILFYFCGKTRKLAITEKSFGNTYSFPYDSPTEEFTEDKITDKELETWFDTIQSHHVSMIFDTSYASYMTAIKQYRRSILTATGMIFPKKDASLLKNERSLLTHFLIKGLKGYADEDNNGIIDITELFTYAKTKCYKESIQHNILSIMNPQIFNFHFNSLSLYDLPFGWKQLTDDGFGKQSNYATRGMEVFNGNLYIGTQNNMIPQSKRFENGKCSLMSTSVLPDFYTLFGDLSHLPIQIALHAMTFVSQGCEIWRYNYSQDSLVNVVGKDSISGVNAGFGYHFNAAAAVMKEYKGHLYVGTWNTPIGSLIQPDRKGCELWRTRDGVHWEQVVGHNAPYTKGGFGNPDNTGAWSIKVFQNYLYVGTMNWDFSDDGGCEVWRSNDGLHWEQVVTHGFREFMAKEDLEKEAINTYAWTMQEYHDELYMGTFNARLWFRNEKGTGCQLWKTSDGTVWQKVDLPDGITGDVQDGFGEPSNYGIRRMVVYNDELYVGIASSFFHEHGCEIWKFDGVNWEPVISDDVPGIQPTDNRYDGFGDPMNKYLWTMTVTVDNTLWVGTGNGQVYLPFVYQGNRDHRFIDAETHGCEIWCYDGVNWRPVSENNQGLKPNGLGDQSNIGARSMIEYPKNSGNIVIGTFKFLNTYPDQPRDGCELWMRYILQ